MRRDVAENEFLRAVVNEIFGGFSRFGIADVAVAAGDTLLQRPGIRAVLEHVGIVIGLSVLKPPKR